MRFKLKNHLYFKENRIFTRIIRLIRKFTYITWFNAWITTNRCYKKKKHFSIYKLFLIEIEYKLFVYKILIFIYTGISSIQNEIKYWNQKASNSSTKSDREQAQLFSSYLEKINKQLK